MWPCFPTQNGKICKYGVVILCQKFYHEIAKKPALSENTPAQILSMPLICTKVVAQIVQHDDRSINTKILENLIFTIDIYVWLALVTSHFLQFQVKSQVILSKSKSSHKSSVSLTSQVTSHKNCDSSPIRVQVTRLESTTLLKRTRLPQELPRPCFAGGWWTRLLLLVLLYCLYRANSRQNSSWLEFAWLVDLR
jgi:hypothetical protein